MQGFSALTPFDLPLTKKYTKDVRPPWKAHTYTHTHLLSLTLQHARITGLMQPSRKTLLSPAKMKPKGLQQPVEISHCVQIKICKGPKSSSPLKWTVSKQLTNHTAQNSSSVISKSIKFSRKNVHQLKFLPKSSPVHNKITTS